MHKEEIITKMKKVGHKRNNGRFVYEWEFIEEDKKRLTDIILSSYSLKKQFEITYYSFDRRGKKKNSHDCADFKRREIKEFISHLEFLCDGAMRIKEDPKDVDIRMTKSDVLKTCKKTLGYLKKIERGKISMWALKKTHPGDGRIPQDVKERGDQMVKELDGSWAAVGPLQKFINILEEGQKFDEKPSGHPPADSNDLIKNIAKIYLKHFGKKPTTYKDGPFVEIVSIALEAVELPFEDPSRGIAKALRDVNSPAQ
ncbi:MAG: hypothetical protein Q7W38_09140 [Deltaproteobacteria bacterium]|nr:hypothetical protein [Deltaproteobacteria bacterium]